MPHRLLERLPNNQSWAASAAINIELSPTTGTITGLLLVLRLNITTTSVTNFSDYYDRAIASLSLVGAGSKNYLSFTEMRAPYHLVRLAGPASPKRPTVIGGSLSSQNIQVLYYFPFGVAGRRTRYLVAPKFAPITKAGDAPTMVDQGIQVAGFNPYDLTAGIAPTGRGNLRLQGSFGSATAMGTNVTINSGQLDVYAYQVLPAAGDKDEDWMPIGIPAWSMVTPTVPGTASAFATDESVPANDFLYDALWLVTRGTNAPRDAATLNSLQLYNQLERVPIISYGGGTSVAADVLAGELISQLEAQGVPASEDVAVANGVPAITQASDAGLYYFPIHRYFPYGHPLFGADLRNVGTGDLRWKYALAVATNTAFDILYRKYTLNPDHPLNKAA